MAAVAEVALPGKIDFYEAVHRMIEEHGDEATIFAAMEADACLENGDLDGKVAWLKVIEAIKIFQDESPPSAITIRGSIRRNPLGPRRGVP